tara:strand:- start:72 stop:446 length:375 start_codon:yes stop_codon:yes gene_type:complete
MSFSQNITSLKNIFIEKDEEIVSLKKEIEILKNELKKLALVKKENDGDKLSSWSDYILHICKDGDLRTVKEIFNKIDKMDEKPWSEEAKTPESSCNERCGALYKKGKLCKTNDKPIKYFILLKK